MAEPALVRRGLLLLALLAVVGAGCGSRPAAAPSATTRPAPASATTSGPTTTTARQFEPGTVESVGDRDPTYRYQAAILDTRAADSAGRLAGNDFDRFICGASLIDARHVLTAAHCVILEDQGGALLPAADLRVVVGRTVLRSGAGERRRVAAVKVHPRYRNRRDDLTYDVAVLTVSPPVTTIRPVALVKPGGEGLTGSRQAVSLTGWGDTSSRRQDQGGPPRLRDRLKVAHSAIVVTIDCPAAFVPHQLPGDWDVQPVLCLRTGDRVGFCSGDSGGPVVAWVGDRPVQVGVIDATNGCADPRFPGILANLAAAPVASFVAAARRGG